MKSIETSTNQFTNHFNVVLLFTQNMFLMIIIMKVSFDM